MLLGMAGRGFCRAGKLGMGEPPDGRSVENWRSISRDGTLFAGSEILSATSCQKRNFNIQHARHHNGSTGAAKVSPAICTDASAAGSQDSRTGAFDTAQFLLLADAIRNLQPSQKGMANQSQTSIAQKQNVLTLLSIIGMPSRTTSSETRQPGAPRRHGARAQGRMPEGRHHEAQEAQFGRAEDCKGAVINWESYHGLYLGRGT